MNPKKLEDAVYDIKEISDKVMEFQYRAETIDCPVNCFETYQWFYDKHKQQNGSYALLRGFEYEHKMAHRFMYIFSNIEQVLDYWEGKPSIYNIRGD